MIVLTSFVIERGFFYLYKMKYILVLILSSCSTYSIHEHNMIIQRKVMLKYDKQSRKVQQKMRSEKQVKKKLVKRSQNKYI